MADLGAILNVLTGSLEAAMAAGGITGAVVGSEWPTAQVRQDAGISGNPPVVAIIHKMTYYKQSNFNFDHYEIEIDKSIQTELSEISLTPGQSATLSVTFTDDHDRVHLGEIVSFVIFNGDSNNAATYVSVVGDTLESVAAGLAESIQTLLPTFTAVATGTDILITNNDVDGFDVRTYSGNITEAYEATSWATRSMQINTWSGSLALKYKLQSVIENWMATLERSDGVQIDTGELVNFYMVSAKPVDSDTDKDIYTDIFLFNIGAWVDVRDDKYPVVAPLREWLP